MRSPRIFITIIFIVSIVLLLLTLPKPITIQKTSQKTTSLDFSNINIDYGPFQFKKYLQYRLGLDLQGGVRLVYELDMKSIPASEQQAAFESARDIIERRVNFFGVAESSIQTLKVGNTYRIIVELPGVTDVNSAIALIGKTAQLTFWEAGSKSVGPETATSSAYPFGMTQVLENKEPVKTQLSGKDLKSAHVVFDPNTGAPTVQLNFTNEGTKLFGDITQRNVGKRVVIVLDNQIIQYPTVSQAILNGNAVISGGFTTTAANSLAIQLNAGALPVPLKIIAQSNIGPSLGIESLQKSLFAGLVGLLSVAVFMIYLYRREGILASVALLIYMIIVLFIFKVIPITLTLAGIAGFILSIGMAVDANILIFERMKEEKRLGKSQDTAVEVGFRRAWSSIRDSNISSLITAFILFQFGTGIVRGFALTLAIGIIVSMFSAITVTRNLLRVFDRRK